MDAKQLEDALMKADAAGDSEGAQVLADELKRLRSAPQPTDARGQFDQLPTWQKPLVAMDDIIRMIANGATFGYADKLAAKGDSALGIGQGGDYAANLLRERAKSEGATDRSGSAGTVAKVGGAVAGMSATGVPSALGLIPRSAPFLARAAMAVPLGAAEGAGMGALQATGEDTDVMEGTKAGAISGAFGGPLAETVGSGVNAFMRRLSGVNRTPTVDELRAGKNALYQNVEDAGAIYPPNRVVSAVNDMNTDLVRPHGGIRPIRHPNAADMLDQMNDVASNTRGESLYDLDILRQSNSADVMSKGGSEMNFGRRIQRGIDDLIGDTSGVTTANGTPQEAVDNLLQAREANRRLGNVEDLSTAAIKAGRRIDSTGTGKSVGNQVRQNIRGILDNEGRSQFFNPEETALMEQVVRGTWLGNKARSAADVADNMWVRGAAASGGGALGATIGGIPGGLVGGAAGVGAASAAGGIARAISDRSTRRLTDDLIHLAATGRRLERGKATGPVTRGMESNFERAIMALGIGESDEERKKRRNAGQ